MKTALLIGVIFWVGMGWMFYTFSDRPERAELAPQEASGPRVSADCSARLDLALQGRLTWTWADDLACR